MSRAFQDAFPENHCWGCGPANPSGLRIKSHWEGDESVCRFAPSPDHMAGPTHVLNGGIIATLVDCHSVCTAWADVYRAEGRELGSAPVPWCVTGSMKIDYLAPTPISAEVELRARVRERSGRKRVVECILSAAGKARARAEVVAIEVPPSWLEPAPVSGPGRT